MKRRKPAGPKRLLKAPKRRWLLLGLLAGAVLFALYAGEYSTPQWLELRAKERAEQRAVDSLTREVDSLTRIRKLVETDPGWQERIAREQYGMLRKGELQFTIVRDR